jgi:hypothetical protein
LLVPTVELVVAIVGVSTLTQQLTPLRLGLFDMLLDCRAIPVHFVYLMLYIRGYQIGRLLRNASYGNRLS